MAGKDKKDFPHSYGWKSKRNYHQVRDRNGVTVAYIITVNGQDIAVSKEVYQAYSQSDRRERYLSEMDQDHGTVLFGDLNMAGTSRSELISGTSANSPEEIVGKLDMLTRLHECLDMLPNAEKKFLMFRYWKGMSQTALAKQLGVSQQAISGQEKLILRKLKKFLKNF
ncbi:MAG: sigma-70 family RNA polymerase sigma factor [Oscillospiraceae bacterium]|nr:sigma-70 family RNA polymerase sigma factor [Oscillospiraceae bacterium]